MRFIMRHQPPGVVANPLGVSGAALVSRKGFADKRIDGIGAAARNKNGLRFLGTR
jgi:hypothetical protein